MSLNATTTPDSNDAAPISGQPNTPAASPLGNPPTLAPAAGAAPNAGTPDANHDPVTYANLDEWLGAQGDDVRTVLNPLLDAHVAGLKSALKSERQARRDADAKVTDFGNKLKKFEGKDGESVELRKQFDELQAGFLEASRKANFLASAAEVQVDGKRLRNANAAYKLAKADDLFNDKGECDFNKLADAYPEFFEPIAKPPAAPTGSRGSNAGNGAGRPPAAPVSFDDSIRFAAGRR